VKTEIRKSLSGWPFWLTLLILCGMTIYSALFIIHSDLEASTRIVRKVVDLESNPMLSVKSLYSNWIGAEWMTPFSTLFFFVFPLCAAIPYGLSLYQERRSGYMGQMVLRETRARYLLNKYVAVFLSGGLVIAVPVVLNIMIIALYFPAHAPDLNYDIYTTVKAFSFGSKLYYEIPWLYLMIRVAVIFWYGGVAATVSMAVTFFSRNRFVILFTPMLFFLLLNYSYTLFQVPYEISPLRFLGSGNVYYVVTPIVIGEALFLSFLTIAFIGLRGRKKDVL